MSQIGFQPNSPGSSAGAAVWAWRGDDAAVADHVSAHISSSRSTSLAIAGGRTPPPILAELAKRRLAWQRTTIYPTDERRVHEAHRDSNYGMLSRALDPTGAWTMQLRPGDTAPRFDLVWLGMSEDGKIASLFPNDGPSFDVSADVISTRPPTNSHHVPHDRLSLSLGAIAAADEVMLVIRGWPKRRVAEDALEGRSDLPLSRLLPMLKAPLRIFWSPA